MSQRIYILNGYQTDFAENWARNGVELQDVMRDTVMRGLQVAQLAPEDIEVAHIGNFVGELFCRQAHLGGLFAAIDPAFEGLPSSRHEGACASGGLAILGASAELEAGRYGLAAVLGIEQLRNVPGETGAQLVGDPAAWAGHEFDNVRFPWPHVFSALGDEYENRYGLKREHLVRIAEINFANGRRNPNAQTRRWDLKPENFSEDEKANPLIEGRLRKQDCGQMSDGAAVLFLANAATAATYARKRGISLDQLPYIRGWGHRTAHITYAHKIAASQDEEFIFPHVRGTILDAYRRAGISGPEQLSGVEVHDCFTVTEYMAIDHLGITPPGQSWQAVENGDIEMGGRIPVNPSGGLIAGGHPIGATGVRMVLDAAKQVSGAAGEYQVEGATDFATLNIGGSATTSVSFVISR